MLVYLDEQPFETTLDPENTIRELIDEIRTSLSRTDRLVMGIRGDGLDITGDGYAETLGKPVASFERYDFVTRDPRGVVREALPECHDLLSAAGAKRAEAIDLLTKGDSREGIAALGECCHAWQQVHEAICNAIELLKLDPGAVKLEGGALTTVLAGTRDQLAQIREALQAGDFVLVSDVLQYEFDPVVHRWEAAIHAILETLESAPRRA